jgi:NADH:ubiquinone oxidoreductase subunit E
MPKAVGAVLVVGGGIGGIQSALDLADSGFKVYLLDKKPSIGGTMAQLDKTFPTNDCSMCIMAPKMVDVARHPNVELLTFSDVMSVDGESGNFEVTIKKKARYIDESKCTGCGVCVDNCHISLQIQPKEDVKKPQKIKDQKDIDIIISKYSLLKNPVLQVLLDINNKYNYIPKDVLKYVSFKLNIPLSKIYQIATFYKAFSLERRGKYNIKICLGTACHVRGAGKLIDKITSLISNFEEGLFSLETVNCLGSCALGPIMVVNDDIHGNITLDKADKIISSIGGL